MALLAFELPVLGDGGAATTTGAAATSELGAAVPSAAAALSSHGTKKSKKGTSSSSKAAAAADALPPMPPHISSLLDPSQRLRTARELNAAILHAQGHPAEPKLPGLMSVMTWGEGLLAEKGVEWPKCASRSLSLPLFPSSARCRLDLVLTPAPLYRGPARAPRRQVGRLVGHRGIERRRRRHGPVTPLLARPPLPCRPACTLVVVVSPCCRPLCKDHVLIVTWSSVERERASLNEGN